MVKLTRAFKSMDGSIRYTIQVRAGYFHSVGISLKKVCSRALSAYNIACENSNFTSTRTEGRRRSERAERALLGKVENSKIDGGAARVGGRGGEKAEG